MKEKKAEKSSVAVIRKLLTYLGYGGYVIVVLLTHFILGIGICIIGLKRKNDMEVKAGIGFALLIFALSFLWGATHDTTLKLAIGILTGLSWIYILARLVMTYSVETEQIRNILR